ncbi:MAG: M23 family metallopeptidase [Patescibacteria group bacterium]|jgi:murein DD-endopeptidase MepM/ murein hydrolase activator NlpD
MRKFSVPKVSLRHARRSLQSFSSHWAIIVLAIGVVLVGAWPRAQVSASDVSHRSRTVAQLASAEYFNENVAYDEVITTVGDNNDYLFKTGATETIITRNTRTETIFYDTKSGESVASVARDFGLSPDTVRYVNKLSSNALKVGQKLKIPPIDGIYVTVQKNDTLSGIAKKYKTALADIRKYNNLPEGEPIFSGQEILVPGVVAPKTTTSGSGSSITSSTGALATALPGGGQFIWPTESPTHFISQGYKNYHRAVDLNRLNGWGIYASAAGVVRTYSTRYGYGNYIDINHGNGYVTRYGHLSQFKVKTGDYVQQGQLIGIMGSTGRSTGPHLHFEIRKNDAPQNPLNYLPR